jgi:hypothetical protein
MPQAFARCAELRRWSAAFSVVICTVMAACGSLARPNTAGAAGGPLLAYAHCMRSHAVSNFPDPSSAGGLVIPNSINTQSPAFTSAEQACAKFGPPGQSRGALSNSRKLQFVAIARCMRAHGVPNFSDPTSSQPPPSGGNAIGGNGWYLALGTAQERQAPAYKRAASTCMAGIP